ncbi:serine hydrolase domain-containing protein [Photobacterium leiognathi]|uniref:serine hydrolase domain-containing protein n=1 Tax=Photobacterium leiognathi TaxID=553611 RepID=UPI002982A530|nr:serine hydrolase [Photobacterium leiognathi]
MKKRQLTLGLMAIFSVNALAAQLQAPDANFLSKAAEHAITIDNWDQGENSASTFPNAYKFTHSYRISHGLLGSGLDVLMPQPLKESNQLDLKKIKVPVINGEMNMEDFLRDRLKNHSMVIAQKDAIIHQHYWNNTHKDSTHLVMSVTKSFTAMIAGIIAAEGKIDMSKPVTDYLPELKDTAWENATVEEVADMRTSLVIPKEEGKSWDNRMTLSQGYNGDETKTYPNGVADYLQLVTKHEGNMGYKYTYQCANTEVLGKVIEAATGQQLADLYESKIWTKVGLEQDAFLMSDPSGFPIASGGLNATTRDLARVGLMLQNNGKNYLGEQVVPSLFIQALWDGNEKVRAAWKLSKEGRLGEGWYKDQFRVLKVDGRTMLAMTGIHGQAVIMDKKTGAVIAMNGGYPVTESLRMAQIIFVKVAPMIFDAIESQPS